MARASLRGPWPGTGRHPLLPSCVAPDTCYYDGRCGLCRRSTRWLRRLDWLGRLAFVDMTAVPEAELPVPMEAAMRGMPMRTRGGRALVGFEAVRRAAVQTPLGFVPAALLYVPGVSRVGRVVYRWIATRRGREACAARSA